MKIICKECNKIMDKKKEKFIVQHRGYFAEIEKIVYVCPSCGWEVKTNETN